MSLAMTRQRSALRGGDRQDAGAGSDIEHPPRPAPAHQSVEHEEAAARRPVMPGAERQRGFDFNGNRCVAHLGAIVAAVDDEAAGRDRRQAGEAGGDPVPVIDGAEANRSRGSLADPGRDEARERRLIKSCGEVGLDPPATGRDLKRRHPDGVEGFRQQAR